MKKQNVREVALDILLQIEKNQAYSNLLLNEKINANNLNRKDVGLLTEIVYGTIQRKNTLDFYLEPYLKKPNKLELWVRVLLRLSCYQISYLDRVPAHAVIHEAVEIAKRKGHRGISGMVNGVLRNVQRNGLRDINEVSDPLEKLAIELSHPKWLVKRWVSQLGEEETRKMCEINVTPPVVTVRVNTVKRTVDEMLLKLVDEGLIVERGDVAPNAIKVLKGNVPETESFKTGEITIQDESSMLVAEAVGPKSTERILDSCAAPGGKTTHLAELMDGSGEVISLDLHEHKVKLIRNAAARLQLNNIQANALDSRNVLEHYEKNSFDRILVDAPCSGFGVLRRKPDIKWSKKEEDISQLASIQHSILTAVAPLLKSDGVLVYSTCTIDVEENDDIVNRFLNDNEEFSLDETLKDRLPEKLANAIPEINGTVQLLPHYFGTDGFYIACFKKS